MLCAMVAGTALVMLVGARPAPVARPASPPPRVAEVEPWLTPEAAAQIVGKNGKLGPLFGDVELGGPAPSVEVRERIERFARTNHVEIDLEIVDARLASVRFAVSYAGCCGYEAADVLSLRLGRPGGGHCCACADTTWIDDWALAIDGVYMRASVRVNRVEVRWAPQITLAELLARANDLIGKDASSVRAAAAERWQKRRVRVDDVLPVSVLEMPYVPDRYPLEYPLFLGYIRALGLQVGIEDGRIAEVSVVLLDLENGPETRADALKTLRATWGRPRTRGQHEWKWRTADRSVAVQVDTYEPTITIRGV